MSSPSRGLAALLPALLLSACIRDGGRPSHPGPPPARTAAASEAKAADLAMNDAVAARDAAAFGRLVAEESLFFGGKGPARGRAEVVASWAPLLAAGGPTLTWAPDRAEAAGSGDLAFTWGGWTWRGADGATEAGRYLTAWRREADGLLRAALDADASPLPPLPAGTTRRVLLTLRSADGRLLAEGGILLDVERTIGHFATLSRVVDGRMTVLSDAGLLR